MNRKKHAHASQGNSIHVTASVGGAFYISARGRQSHLVHKRHLRRQSRPVNFQADCIRLVRVHQVQGITMAHAIPPQLGLIRNPINWRHRFVWQRDIFFILSCLHCLYRRRLFFLNSDHLLHLFAHQKPHRPHSNDAMMCALAHLNTSATDIKAIDIQHLSEPNRRLYPLGAHPTNPWYPSIPKYI